MKAAGFDINPDTHDGIKTPLLQQRAGAHPSALKTPTLAATPLASP